MATPSSQGHVSSQAAEPSRPRKLCRRRSASRSSPECLGPTGSSSPPARTASARALVEIAATPWPAIDTVAAGRASRSLRSDPIRRSRGTPLRKEARWRRARSPSRSSRRAGRWPNHRRRCARAARAEREPAGRCVHCVLWIWPREAQPAAIANVALSGLRLIATQACERSRNRPPEVLGGAWRQGHGQEGTHVSRVYVGGGMKG